MEFRKRPRLEGGGGPAPPSSSRSRPQSSLAALSGGGGGGGGGGASPPSSSSSSTSAPAVRLLEAELRALRSELDHSQSIRSIERKNSDRTASRLRRQLADAHEEVSQGQELAESLREGVDAHARKAEESRREWMEQIKWYEERWEEAEASAGGGGGGGGRDGGSDDEEAEGRKCDLLRRRLDAAEERAGELERALGEAEERRVEADERAAEAELGSAEARRGGAGGGGGGGEDEASGAGAEVPRELRIKVAEAERENRELRRQVEDLKDRVRDAVQHRERAASSQRRAQQLERELKRVNGQLEEGREARRRWARFRDEIAAEGLIEEGDESAVAVEEGGPSVVPPEITAVARKVRTLKGQVKEREDEIARVNRTSEAHSRRCKVLESQSDEKDRTISSLDAELKDRGATVDRLELENRKIAAQQQIWRRESEGMRSLLDTYEQQETVRSKSPASKRKNPDGLQLSLDSAREEVRLLSKSNETLEGTVEELRNERRSAEVEHARVLDKFGKLRNALLEERSKAEAAEARACQAETLAGKGSYNDETTRVLRLKSNPLADALREKHQAEIDALTRRLEEAEALAASARGGVGEGATTPDASRGRGSFGSAGSGGGRGDSAVDVQKLHSRLKEQFRNQIALFREGVYLITGFKVDMTQGEGDCQVFTVRSVYGEREEDHLLFKWSPKRKDGLDMLTTDMARLLVKGPCGMYVTEHGSIPGFMASVTLQLFDQQTVL